jgi:hypothetical protein
LPFFWINVAILPGVYALWRDRRQSKDFWWNCPIGVETLTKLL